MGQIAAAPIIFYRQNIFNCGNGELLVQHNQNTNLAIPTTG